MAEVGWFDSTFEAIKPKLVAALAGKLTGGFQLAEMPELSESDPNRGKRPYGVVNPVALRDTKFTSKTKYATLEMNFEVHADDFRELDKVINPAITAGLQHTLTGVDIGGIVITMIRPGDIEYEKIEQIWTSKLTFFVQAQQPAAQSAS
jgi:hypothetical protein